MKLMVLGSSFIYNIRKRVVFSLRFRDKPFLDYAIHDMYSADPNPNYNIPHEVIKLAKNRHSLTK